MSVARAEALRAHIVTTVAVLSDSQAAIRRTTHLDPRPGQHLVRAINEHARALRTYSIESAIHWVPGHSCIPGNEVADRQPNNAREDRGYTVHDPISTSPANRARRISERTTAAQVNWQAEKSSKHYAHRLKGKAWSKSAVPMTSVKSLAMRFYTLKSGQAPNGTYLKRFGQRENDKCWWCGSRMLQTQEHLFRHSSRCRDQQTELWKAVGKATGCKAGRCCNEQISELFTPEKCDEAEMDFLAATDVAMYPPKLEEEPRHDEPGQEAPGQEKQGQG